jgi:N-acetylmuramoyl-L-alanine amidase
MYAPLESLLKIVGMSASREDSLVSVSGAYKPLRSAKNFYRDDEVLWLSRIITAEAKGESLIGQIAVGNVIMNRVGSSLYPDTIYGVIFDRKYGVQFSPVLDGSIYNTPTYTATLAAKIILEGTRLSEDSLFFLNPTTAESNWIVKNREYLYTIGGHDFYR